MQFMKVSLLLCMSLQYALCQNGEPAKKSEESPINYGLLVSLKQCVRQKDMMDCLKRKVIQKIDDEMKQNRTFEITDEIVLKREIPQDYENSIPDSQRSMDLSSWRSETAPSTKLNEVLIDKVNEYVKSIVVQFKMSGETEEGRRRKHKHHHAYLMYGILGIASVLGQLFLGKIAMISGAALLFSKVALAIAVLTGLKKLSSGHGTSEHIVYSTDHGSHGGWQRSAIAQEMAYRAQAARQRTGMEGPSGYAVYEDPNKELGGHL